MTITMADDIYATNLPPGYAAYAGYVNGWWPDFIPISQRNPTAYLLPIAVTASADATCLDIENGDATASQAPAWVQRQLARGIARPVVYSSISNMPSVLSALAGAGIARASVRLWSAHYEWQSTNANDPANQHICGPFSCKYQGASTPSCDGTQWDDKQPGLNGSQIDVSVLLSSFFAEAGPPPPAPVSVPPSRRNIYTPVATDGSFGSATIKALQFVTFDGNTADVDGIFGLLSKRSLQWYLHVPVDGVIGPITVKALQARVGAAQDGSWGPLTTKALQTALNRGTF